MGRPGGTDPRHLASPRRIEACLQSKRVHCWFAVNATPAREALNRRPAGQPADSAPTAPLRDRLISPGEPRRPGPRLLGLLVGDEPYRAVWET